MPRDLSSGSEHEDLSGLVQAFFECDDSAPPSGVDAAAAADDVFDGGEIDWDGGQMPEQAAAVAVAAAAVGDLLRGLPKGDGFRLRLLSDASTGAEALSALRVNGSAYRRGVMTRLREMGYDAGICKARWEKSPGVIAGSYEYIDVVATAAAGGRRYIVDLGFAAEFVVARATPEYEQLVAALPELMVALPVEVREAVKLVGEAGRRSLKAQGLHVPPWRRGRYMMAKWFAPYRRTVNATPASAGVPVVGGGDANCRGLGFAARRVNVQSLYRLI